MAMLNNQMVYIDYIWDIPPSNGNNGIEWD